MKINDYYFCLQQNPAVFAWILFFKSDDLITIQPWLKKDIPRWTKTYFQYHWNLFKRNLFNLIIFLQCRLGLRHLDTLQLPVYGHFGMHVHKGYKIFNLYSGVVTKIFDPDVNALSIINEIDHLKIISQINFAPSLRRWDSGERWYEEDYMRGAVASKHRATDSDTFLKAFYQEAAPCMKSLILFKPLVTKDPQTYLDELIEVLDISRVPEWNANSTEADTIVNFINLTVKCLKSEGSQPIDLVFTHGDFCPANILSTKDGIRIIDWETAGYRSLLFDFYSYFFYRPVNINNISVEQMASEIHQSLPIFITGLDRKLTISDSVYRRLFYLEYVFKLVERLCTDKRLNIMDFIMRYINAFSLFDQNCYDGTRGCQVKSMISTDSFKNSL